MRPPRFIKSDGILRPYLRQEAEGLLLLQVSTIVADAWNECCRRCVGGLLLQLRGRIVVAATWEDYCCSGVGGSLSLLHGRIVILQAIKMAGVAPTLWVYELGFMSMQLPGRIDVPLRIKF